MGSIRRPFNAQQSLGTANIEMPDTYQVGTVTNNPFDTVKWKVLTKPNKIKVDLPERSVKKFGRAQSLLLTTNVM